MLGLGLDTPSFLLYKVCPFVNSSWWTAMDAIPDSNTRLSTEGGVWLRALTIGAMDAIPEVRVRVRAGA